MFAPQIARMVNRSYFPDRTIWPYTALRICRHIRHEAKPTMVTSITFDISDFHLDEVPRFLGLGGMEKVLAATRVAIPMMWGLECEQGSRRWNHYQQAIYTEGMESLKKVYRQAMGSEVVLVWSAKWS